MQLRRGVFFAGLFLLVLLGTLPVSGRASVPLSTPTVVAGGGGGLTIPCCTAPFPAPTDVKLQLPQFIAAGGAQLYLPVPATNQVYAANFNNPATIKTVAGDGTQGSGGDGSAATGAELDGPSAVAIGGPGYYVADTNNNRVRAVDTGDGKINTVAGGAVFNGPRDISVSAGGGYYVLDTSGVRRVDAGAITATWNRYDPIYAVDAIDDTHFWIATLNGIVEGLIDTTDAVHGGTAIGGFAASSRTFRDVIGLADGGVLAWDDGNDAWGGIVRFAPGGEESVVLGGLTPSPYTLTAHMALTGNGLYFTRYS